MVTNVLSPFYGSQCTCIREYVSGDVDCIYTAHYAGASDELRVLARRKETLSSLPIYNVSLTYYAHMAMERRSCTSRLCTTMILGVVIHMYRRHIAPTQAQVHLL